MSEHDSGTYKAESLSKEPTGATRSNRAGKGRYDLIPTCGLRRLARRYEEGANHHGERNWEKGVKSMRMYDAVMRHLNQWRDGHTDEDHLAAACWNVMGMMFNEDMLPEMDDRPRYKSPSSVPPAAGSPGGI